jgi:hypothetical protein
VGMASLVQSMMISREPVLGTPLPPSPRHLIGTGMSSLNFLISHCQPVEKVKQKIDKF